MNTSHCPVINEDKIELELSEAHTQQVLRKRDNRLQIRPFAQVFCFFLLHARYSP